MTERSWFWEGEVTGDATMAPYDNDELTDALRKLTQFDRETILPVIHSPPGYPLPYVGLETIIVGSSVVAQPGWGIIDGKLFSLTEPKGFDLSREGYYKLVVRKSFPTIDAQGNAAGQTVTLEMLYDESGYQGAPIPTRVDGSIWEVTLAAYWNNQGTIDWYPDKFSHKYLGQSSEYGVRNFPQSAMCLPFRAGGDPTHWAVPGTTRYVVGMTRFEFGSFVMSSNPQSHTFAEAFSGSPIVILSVTCFGSIWAGNNICVSSVSNTAVSVRVDSMANLDYVNYLAIGPV